MKVCQSVAQPPTWRASASMYKPPKQGGTALPLGIRYSPNIYYPFCCFLNDNGDYFKVYSKTHSINTRNKSNPHLPISNLSVYKKGTYYTGIRVFYSLPSQIKEICRKGNQFKRALKIFLYFHLFRPWMNIFVVIKFIIFTIIYLFLVF